MKAVKTVEETNALLERHLSLSTTRAQESYRQQRSTTRDLAGVADELHIRFR